ncbi:putative short-chain dehydrogenase/reductase [Xylogone sp. PMI_703]|nr:putative short-chain dehydrogenase/reductase [Xylogone sp. PMI_703]
MASRNTRKSVLITGCSAGGIGDALAQEFHRKGCQVFATARSLEKIQHLKEIGITIIQLDVLEESSLKHASELVQEVTDGKLDILVNNAGIGFSMPLLDIKVEEARKILDTNIIGVILATQAFAPLLIAAQGTIVNIGSIVGYTPLPFSAVYNASKAGVNQLTNTMRLEMEPLGVRVVLAITGVVKTNFLSNSDTSEIPSTSVYNPGKIIIQEVMSGDSIAASLMDPATYSHQFVGYLLKSKPPARFWLGGLATATWVVNTFFWPTLWDVLYRRSAKLAELKRMIMRAK